jgi:hypothetical protein
LSGNLPSTLRNTLPASTDVWAAWSLVFPNKRASRAILLPTVGDNSKEAASRAAILDRARHTADRLHGAWRVVIGLRQRDPGAILESEISIGACFVSCRVQEYEIDFDFDGRLNLKKDVKQVCNNLIKPFCIASTLKGSCLTTSETKAVIGVCTEGATRVFAPAQSID